MFIVSIIVLVFGLTVLLNVIYDPGTPPPGP
jgi:hypothetical protein